MGFWKMEGTGEGLNDATAGENHMTAVGSLKFAPGRFGKGILIDTTTTDVGTKTNKPLEVLSAYTISLWVKRVSVGGPGQQPRIFVADGASIQSAKAQNNVLFDIPGYAVWADRYFNGEFQHLAVAVDITKNNAVYYIDGENVLQSNNPGVSVPLSGLIYLGHTPGAPSNVENFGGVMDQLRIYNRALTPGEISTLASEPEDKPPTPLVCPSSPPCGACEQCGCACVDTSSDPKNCGGCGVECGGWQSCQAGKCDELPGLVSLWKMDTANSSDPFEDSFGDKDLSKTGSVKTTEALFGQGFELNENNTDGWLKSTDDAFFLPEYTVSMWVKRTASWGTNPERIMAIGGAFLLTQTAEKELTFSLVQSGKLMNPTGVNLDDGMFHHLVSTRTSDGKCLAYVDGLKEGEINAVSPQFTPIGGVSMGEGKSVENIAGFHGVVDQVRIFRRALSPGEIVGLYKEM